MRPIKNSKMAEIDGNELNSQEVEVSRIGLKIRSIYMLKRLTFDPR